MKARLLFDSLGPNPEFRPPPRKDKLAYARYCARVRHSITVKAGTILEGPDVWVHCLPDAQKVIRCEPADEDCADLVAHHKGEPLPSIVREAAEQLAADQAQAEGEAAPQAPPG